MPCTMIIAKVKKMDITNKVTADSWSQSITITLSDIELNDENLIAIRKFRPNEEVQVHLKSLQLSMEEITERENLRKMHPTSGEICSIEHTEDIEEITFEDFDEDLFELDYEENSSDSEKILKSFDFSKM